MEIYYIYPIYIYNILLHVDLCLISFQKIKKDLLQQNNVNNALSVGSNKITLITLYL